QLDVADHRQATRACGIEEGTVHGYARGQHQQIRLGEQRRIETAGAQRERAATRLGQLRQRCEPWRLLAAIGARDADATREQKAGHRYTGLAQAYDHGAARPLQQARTDLIMAWRLIHRSFKVERPASTSSRLMIQKRTMTFGSAHPLSSK